MMDRCHVLRSGVAHLTNELQLASQEISEIVYTLALVRVMDQKRGIPAPASTSHSDTAGDDDTNETLLLETPATNAESKDGFT